MKPEHYLTLANVLLTAIGLYFGPKFAVKRALEQFRAQKWWEKKEAIYTTLLEQLSLLNQFGLQALAGIQTGQGRNLSEADHELMRKAHHVLKQSVEYGSYLISDQAAKALQKVIWADGEDAFLYYDDLTSRLAAAIKILRDEANLEIPLRRVS